MSEIQNKADNQYANPLLLFLLTVYLQNMIMELQVFKGWFPGVCLYCLPGLDNDRSAIQEFRLILRAKAVFVIY